jgi:hypothetical protein
MNMPGFNAEASVYRTTAQYAMGPARSLRAPEIVPMWSCGNCTCPKGCEVVASGWCHCTSFAEEEPSTQPATLLTR